MSLRSFLNTPYRRDFFTKSVPKPKFKMPSEMSAPPLTKNYSIIGVAFDYLFRFFLKKINKNIIENIWIAEKLLTRADSPILDQVGIDGHTGKVIEYKENKITKSLKQIISNCKKQQERYFQTGVIQEELLKSLILLSQFDLIYRSGQVFDIKTDVDKDDTKDLRNLFSILEKKQELFFSQTYCFLNPSFGEASKSIGGADADIIIDDLLIDIKTSVKPEFNRDHFNQILSYYLLSQIGGIDGINKKIYLKKIGIYFSRFGVLLTIEIDSILENNKMQKFLEWFKNEVANYKGANI